MAIPTVIAKNQTGTGIFLPRLGLTCPASPGTITLTDFVTFFEVASEEVLETKVSTGDIVINDGDSDLSTAEALGFLDATGNLNGPVAGLTAGRILRLADTTGRYTESAANKLYDPSATDPAGGAEGDLYYNTVLDLWMSYDSARGKWLSVEVASFQTGHNGVTPVGNYYRGVSGKTFSNTIGYTAPYKGTVVGVTYTRGNAAATAFEVTANGALTTSSASAATAGLDNSLNGDFNQGDILALRNDAAGNSTQDAQVWVRMKWRV